MSVSITPLWEDVKKIMYSGNEPYRNIHTATVRNEKYTYAVDLFDSLVIMSDYAVNLGDYIVLKINVPMGEYFTKFHPYKNNLEVDLTKSIDVNGKVKKTVNTYKAVLVGDDISLDGTALDNMKDEVADNMSSVSVELQLVDPLLEVLRTIEIGGIYKNTNNYKIILGVLETEAAKITINGKKGLDNINIVPVDNKAVYGHTIIPDGTKLVDIATYLHHKNYGLYNGDVGTYFTRYKNKTSCFIYPLYNFTRHKSDTDIVIFYSIPTSRFDLVDNTYLQDGKSLMILVGDNNIVIDQGDSSASDTGIGFRMSDSSAIAKKPVVMTEDGPIADRKSLNYEVISKEKEDGVNYAPLAKSGSNPFLHYSNILKKSGSIVVIDWKYSNPDLIYPGMSGSYVFMKKATVYKAKAVVLNKYSIINKEGINVTKVTLFIETKDYR